MEGGRVILEAPSTHPEGRNAFSNTRRCQLLASRVFVQLDSVLGGWGLGSWFEISRQVRDCHVFTKFLSLLFLDIQRDCIS